MNPDRPLEPEDQSKPSAPEVSTPEQAAELDSAPPVQPAATVYSSGDGAVAGTPEGSGKNKWSRKKKLLVIGVPLLALLAIGTGSGLYWYNSPGTVWNMGLSRTGTAFNKITDTAIETKNLDKLKTSDMSGKVTVKSDDFDVTGDAYANFNASKLNAGVDVEFESEGDSAKVSARILSDQPEGEQYPEVYAKISGLAPLGVYQQNPELAALEDRWVYASPELIEQYAAMYGASFGEREEGEQISSADVSEVATAVQKVSNEYVFTSDKDKAVLEQKSFAGKETVDGVKTHHYKANINLDNATKYCEAVSNAFLSTNAYKKVSGRTDSQISNDKDRAKDDCAEESDQPEDFDVWIGGKYRMIHKVRVSDGDGGYVEFGQNYKGGNELPLFINYTDDEDQTAKVTFTVNAETYDVKLGLKVATEDYDITANFTSKPSSKDVKVEKPEEFIPAEQVMSLLGIDPSGGSAMTPRTQSELYTQEDLLNYQYQ